MADPTKNIAETLIEHLSTTGEVQDIVAPVNATGLMCTPFIYAVPKGLEVRDLTDAAQKVAQTLQPYRRKGTAQMQDLAGLITWANRFKGPSSILYGNISEKPSLTCIADYHGEGAPVMDDYSRDPTASYGRHRAVYMFPLSEEWLRWKNIDDKPLARDAFGEFIEANAKDLLAPTAALLRPDYNDAVEPWETRMQGVAEQLQGRFGHYSTLVQLSRAFTVNETAALTVTSNRDTGESSIQFLNEHRDPDGNPIRIPNLFIIAIPVFENGAAYRIAVRFRYIKAGADVKFRLSLHTPEITFRDAVEEAATTAMAQTGLPLINGIPEA